jgi:hypothetical protein
MKKILTLLSLAAVLFLSPSVAFSAPGTPVQQDAQDLKAATLETTATGAANTAVTATIGAGDRPVHLRHRHLHRAGGERGGDRRGRPGADLHHHRPADEPRLVGDNTTVRSSGT